MHEIERKKIAVADLKPGMYVTELDRPWFGTPFLFQGFLITSATELEQLRGCCQYVYVDLQQSKAWTPDEPKQIEHDPELGLIDYLPDHDTPTGHYRFSTHRLNVEPKYRRHPPQDVKTLVAGVKAARRLHRRTHEYVNTVLEDARFGRSLDVGGARELVSEMVDAIIADKNALLWLAQLKRRDEYTTLHSINVCILALLFGSHLNFNAEQLREIGHGALLHDIGKMRVPVDLLNKTSELTDDELAVLKRHPEYGYEMLKDTGMISAGALDIVYSHHERFDGSGYPRGLRGDDIGEYAMLVSIVDVYDAITSDRVYHLGMSPHEALNLMYEWEPKNFPQELLEEFIKCLGIYPIGSIVELNTGEVGVVMTVNRMHHLRPIVMLLLNPAKEPYPIQKMINLELYAVSQSQVNIVRILESNAYGIDVNRLIFSQAAAEHRDH